MTRNTAESSKSLYSWGDNGMHIVNGNELLSGTETECPRPKGRIRRSMTACNTCRKLKTRCDLDPRIRACRRCLSLRLNCKLPEMPSRAQESLPIRADALEAIPSIEERLTFLERGMGEMTRMMRDIVGRSPSIPCSSALQSTQSISTPDASNEGSPFTHCTPNPGRQFQELQSEFFGGIEAANPQLLGDMTTKGIIVSGLSLKLMQVFVDHFGSWVSIGEPSDIHDESSQTDPFLFNTACFLASRYIQGITPRTVHTMYLQVRHAAIHMLWNTSPVTYSSLQALTLLCLWSAKIEKEASMDSWLLSGISINHAIISFDFLNSVRERIINDDLVKKLRLWNALCLTQLHSAIGNARPFGLQEKYLEYCPRILEHPSATFADRKVVAEIHLYHITLRLQSDNQTQFREGGYEEIERWKMNWVHLMANEKHSTLELNLWFCELLLRRAAMIQSNSKRLVAEILDKSRLIVSSFLQTSVSSALAYIDQIYFIVGYAALTLCDFNVADSLVDQVQAFLIHLSPSEDHIAGRFSRIIAEFKRRDSSIHAGPIAGADVLGAGPGPLRATFDQGLCTPPLTDAVTDGNCPLEHFVPEQGFLPAYSLGNVFQGIPLDVGVANGLVQQSG